MRIAITADLHLTTVKDHPERFEVLKNVLQQCGELELDWLIIAGDLFDRSQTRFADFERAYASAHTAGLSVTVIPGNHDSDLVPGALAAKQLEVLTEPTLRAVGDEFGLLLIPYAAGSTMGEHLPPFRNLLTPGQWALVGHGDWTAGRRAPNPYEPGTYMPLTRSDLDAYEPAVAFLGHIHAPTDDPPVHYPGSPYPLDINETGLRRFLVFDSESREVSEQWVDSPRLYFNETLVMLPLENEQEFVQAELDQRIASWELPEDWRDRVQLRLRIVGYARDRGAVENAARETMREFAFYDDGPDLSDLHHAADVDRIHVARQVRQWIDELDWSASGPAEPDAEAITLEAMRVIWGD